MAGFAGSQHSDERRRRRLAVEQDGLPRRKSKNNSSRVDGAAEEIDLVHLTIGELIPKATWFHLLITLILGLAAFGGQYGVAQIADNKIVDPETLHTKFAEAQRVLGGLCLLLAAQAAYVIRLVRGRCRSDFSGSYRLWNWIIAGLGLLSLCQFLPFHLWIGEWVYVMLDRPQLISVAMAWQIPALLAGSVILLRLRREMRDSGLTSWFLHLSMACYVIALSSGITLVGGWIDSLELPASSAQLALWAALSGHLMLFATMTLHAAYVVHVNPEPPVSEIKHLRVTVPVLHKLHFPRLRLPRVRLSLPRLKLFARSSKKPVADTASSPKDSAPQQADETESTPAPKKRRTARKSQARIEPAHTDPPMPAPKIEASRPAAKPKRMAERPIEEQLDDVSPEELKGLSKKQRRQLRKQRREAQRSTGRS